MIFAVALILIFLAAAAPVVARDLQREREVEMIHRGNQYVRAIRLYYRKFGHYPGSIDELVKSNNIRFLRQQYADPMTGKPDWRIIHLGENKTKVTGFFGEPLDSLIANGINGANNLAGGGGAGGGGNTQIQTVNTGISGSTGSTGSTGNDATTFKVSGGPIIGISSLSTKTSIITIHGKNTYDTWEFLYDPLIEKLYNSSQLAGGGGGLNGGLGSMNGTSGTGNGNSNNNSNGSSNSNGFGATNSSFGSGFGGGSAP
jgi:type II secretory pathway pseudopilin PulG